MRVRPGSLPGSSRKAGERLGGQQPAKAGREGCQENCRPPRASRGSPVAHWSATGTTHSVLRGRCNSEPAVTVRDPTAASGRLTWWNSRTDGESPDGRQHAGRPTSPGRAVAVPALRRRPSPASRRDPGAPRAREHRVPAHGEQWQQRESDAMRRAVALAASAGDAPHPNPNVGAVVLDAAGAVVGEGLHERAGDPPRRGRRAHPGRCGCSWWDGPGHPRALHAHGRTGPCSEALLAAGVARVVYALADPTAPQGRRPSAARRRGRRRGRAARRRGGARQRMWIFAVRLRARS